MSKNANLKLFTKTWPLKRDKKINKNEEDLKRPLTATLEKPTVLDIRFLGKIDMSLVSKEFLNNISTLCRLPLVIVKKPAKSTKPLTKIKKKRKKFDPSDDSREDDESSVIQSAKIKSKLSAGNNQSTTRSNNILAIKNDANNNHRTGNLLKIPLRKPTLTTIINKSPNSNFDPLKSTKLPFPCKTCGRPDLPERFHSHPNTNNSKSVTRERGVVPSTMELEKTVKSLVQKPVAIKYKSENVDSNTKPKKSVIPIPKIKPTNQKNVVRLMTSSAKQSAKDIREVATPPARGGSAKRTLTCYICAREFGTASLALHEPKCLQKWERENASLPSNLRRKPPVKPQGNFTQNEWNQLAWESSQANLVPCNNCGRTFYPDRLEVHQRSCKIPLNIKNETISSTNSSLIITESCSTTSTKSSPLPPQSMECYICGKKFGQHSIKIHEKQCLKKWHVENESLPFDMRSPAPTKREKINASSIEVEASRVEPSISERSTSAGAIKSPLFPCYLCGNLFTVNSTYIHEPQCLKMWKIENDKLPPSKRRAVPLKPDVKFTPSGKLNFEETSDAYWQTHLSQLVPCKMCSRTFNPDRVAVHERSCKGN